MAQVGIRGAVSIMTSRVHISLVVASWNLSVLYYCPQLSWKPKVNLF
jgi:hypothetical protein